MRNSRLSYAVAVVCALIGSATPAQADIYAFTDERGVTHFSNVPHDARYAVMIASAPPETRAGERVNQQLLKKAAQYDSIIEGAATTSRVEPELLRAIIVVESGFNPAAVSTKGARGLMQLMPVTAQAYGVTDASDPAQNVKAGARYLRDLLDRYGDDLTLALAAYNAGEGAVERFGKQIPPFRETRAYVPEVLRIYRALRDRIAH